MQTENITALQLFETGLKKSEIKMMAANAVESVLEQGNVLQVAEAVAAMETFVKEVRDDARFKDYVREEAAKTPKGFISNSGAKIECCETGVKYDYSNCNDPVYLKFASQVEEANTQLKLHQDFLKTVPAAGLVITDETTGETYKIYPPTKTSISSFKITLAR